MGFIADQYDGSGSLVSFGGEVVHRLADQRAFVEAGSSAEGRDYGLVDAACGDGGVAQVDHGVPGGVQVGQGGAKCDSFAGSDVSCYDAEGGFGYAPADAGDGLGVAVVAVQHAGGEGAAERGAGEPEVGGQLVHAHRLSSCSSAARVIRAVGYGWPWAAGGWRA